jgi:hypothetical protein
MTKCIGFASNGTFVTIGKKKGVSIKLKKMNPYLTSTHCVAHDMPWVSRSINEIISVFEIYKISI